MQVSFKIKNYNKDTEEMSKSLIKHETIRAIWEVLLIYIDISIEEAEALISHKIEFTKEGVAVLKYTIQSVGDKNIKRQIDQSIRAALYNKFEK